MKRFILGLDLGQAADYSAVAIIEPVKETRAEPAKVKIPDHGTPYISDARNITESTAYHVRHLQRFKLGTSYPDIVKNVQGMITKLGGNTSLVIDHTGVGRPVYDLFKQAGMRPIAVNITGGNNVTHDNGVYGVPKRDLVGALSVSLQAGTLKVASSLPDADTLTTELLAFKVKINTRTAHDSYEAWREGDHDDLVLAVGLAVWYARKFPNPYDLFKVSSGVRRW